MNKPKVIIYDDEVIILHVLEHFFSRRGYEVFSYSNPVVCPLSENLTGRCEKACADVMISDFQMPKLSGIELFQQLAERGCKIDRQRKAIISGNSDEALLKMCADLGCHYFLKPFAFSELSRWLSGWEHLPPPSPLVENKRANKRHAHNMAIEYLLHPADPLRRYRGITIDKSNSGLGLTVFHALQSGEVITIINSPEAPAMQGTVLWCNKLGEDMYRAGVRLSQN